MVLLRLFHRVFEEAFILPRCSQHLGRWRGFRVINARAQAGQRRGVVVATVSHIQHPGKRLHVVKQRMCNGSERLFAVVHEQIQVWLSAVVDDTGLVFIVFTLLAGSNGRTLTKKAHQQQDVGKGTLLGKNADVHERVQVKQAYLQVFDTVFRQGQRRTFTGLANPLGPNAGIKFILNLQQIRVELLPVVAFAHAQLFVERVRGANRHLQCLGVLGQ